MNNKSVLQDWVIGLTFMQQSVLIAAIRGPDGIGKDHQVKRLCRWLRRCILMSAFDGKVVTNPFYPGGGSFTGPSLRSDVAYPSDWDWREEMTNQITEYLRHVDELPHHFQLHFMHAAEIIGYKHPSALIGGWWKDTYLRLANDMHLNPETEEKMDYRLGDLEKQWRACEEVTAKPPPLIRGDEDCANP
jgi:hypothetical protein